MRVAVLGAGPAGLLAAHAAWNHGWATELDIFSMKVKSPMGGAQYLHESIPDITDEKPDGKIEYHKVGTREGYAKKVYGDFDAPTSWDHFALGYHSYWSLRDAYAKLCDLYWDEVFDTEITPMEIEGMCMAYDRVLCTLPANKMCQVQQSHNFEGQKVVLAKLDVTDRERDNIIYSGSWHPWYRRSSIAGETWVEFALHGGEHPDWPLIDAQKVYGIKPISNNCDCHLGMPNFHRLGRFGKWEKGVLVNHAYHDALEIANKPLPARGASS